MMADFMQAVKWMREGKLVCRKDKDFRAAFDYVRLGVEDEYEPKNFSFFKDGKWERSADFWVDDFEGADWEEYVVKGDV